MRGIHSMYHTNCSSVSNTHHSTCHLTHLTMLYCLYITTGNASSIEQLVCDKNQESLHVIIYCQ